MIELAPTGKNRQIRDDHVRVAEGIKIAVGLIATGRFEYVGKINVRVFLNINANGRRVEASQFILNFDRVFDVVERAHPGFRAGGAAQRARLWVVPPINCLLLGIENGRCQEQTVAQPDGRIILAGDNNGNSREFYRVKTLLRTQNQLFKSKKTSPLSGD